jgi:hypothetical protein
MAMGRRMTVASLLGLGLVCGLLLLGGCGGSDDSTSTSTSSSAAGAPAQDGDIAGSTTESGSQGGGSGGSEPSDGSSSVSAGVRVTSLKVSGGGSGQFRVKGGGDNSVQEFGEEGDEDQLREAAETVHDFYARRATCALISKSLKQRLEELAKKTPQAPGTDCPSFLAFSTADLSPAEWRQITTVDAGSLRHEGEQAFLIYYGPERTVYAMPMVEEDGALKVDALTSAALPGA